MTADRDSLLRLSARQHAFITADTALFDAQAALSAAKDAVRTAEDVFWPAWDALTAREQEQVNEVIRDEKRSSR